MAHKKGLGSSKNGRDSNAQRLGVKRFGGFSMGHWWSIVLKEFIQLKRDRLTLGMIIGLPLIQLFLFGYAINLDPKHLPAGLLSPNHSKYERTLVAALQNTGYFDIVPLTSENRIIVKHGLNGLGDGRHRRNGGWRRDRHGDVGLLRRN